MKKQTSSFTSVASFSRWVVGLGLSTPAKAIVDRIRSSEPFRRTQGRFNVRGTYPSRKMGRTIQFEAHRTEFPTILDLEHDPEVLEYWDQPGPIKVCFTNGDGKRTGYQHVPDFFVLRREQAGWVECKTEEKLREASSKHDQLYVRRPDGEWSCPPAEAYAAQFGLTYTVRTGPRPGVPLTRNIHFLDDYFRPNYPAPAKDLVSHALNAIRDSQGIVYPDLLKRVRKLSVDDLN